MQHICGFSWNLRRSFQANSSLDTDKRIMEEWKQKNFRLVKRLMRQIMTNESLFVLQFRCGVLLTEWLLICIRCIALEFPIRMATGFALRSLEAASETNPSIWWNRVALSLAAAHVYNLWIFRDYILHFETNRYVSVSPFITGLNILHQYGENRVECVIS